MSREADTSARGAWSPRESGGGESPPSAGVAPEISTGWFDGRWYTEEAAERTRVSLRVEHKLCEERTEFQRIAVYQTAYFGKLLTLDDLVMLTERDEFVYHEMLVHVPLLSLPSPRAVLIIGGGDCGCAREALRHPVERVVQCEIDEGVTRVCRDHFPWVEETLGDPRLECIAADGARYVRECAGEFDLIIVDSTDPCGAALALFGREFYGSAARALRPGGVLVAQTESPHWGSDTMVSIYRELRAGLRRVTAYLGTVPTYPGGLWSWAYASEDRRPGDFFDAGRAATIESRTRYYNRELQRAAFALPTFVRRIVNGEDPFASFASKPPRAARD